MAGLEVVVRPVVFPNIRPAPARALAPEDDPEQGIAVISGSGGRLIDLPHSWSASVSRSRPQTETKRQFDKERVHQVDSKGNVSKENYVDVERLKKVRMDSGQNSMKMIFTDPPPRENVKILETDIER